MTTANESLLQDKRGSIDRKTANSRLVANSFLNLCLVVASVILALGIAELFFRFFHPQSIIPRYVETGGYGIRKNIANVKGAMITPEYRHQFNTNSEGFRGTKDYAIPKPSETYRVVVLGDSVTLGHGVEDDETFSALLEHDLSLSKPTEVINMGVSGFGTAEELVQLRNLVWKYQPDLVVLSYFQNDPYNNVVSGLFKVNNGKLLSNQQAFVPAIYIRDRLYSIPGYSFLCQHSHVVNFIRNHLSGLFIEHLANQNNISSQTSSTLTPEELELTGMLLEQVIAEAVEHKVSLIILNIPLIYHGEVIDNMPRDRFQEAPKSFYLVDVKESIYASHSLTEISYDKDSHPKPYAHQLIGKWLSKFIQHEIWGKD